MKKLFFILFVSMMSFQAFSQSNQSIGPVIGVGPAWIVSDPSNDAVKSRIGFQGGLLYNYSFTENWGVGLNLLYSIIGAATEAGGDKYNTDLHYVKVPIKLQYYFGELGDNIRPKLFVGPSLGFLAGAKAKVAGVADKVDIKDNYNGFDLGALIGGGANFKLGEETWLNLDLGYTHGLTDALKADNVKFTNSNLFLNVGVGFGF